MSDFATIGEQAPSSRRQRRAPYRESISGEERYANDLATPAQILEQRCTALDAEQRIERLRREAEIAMRSAASAADHMGNPDTPAEEKTELHDRFMQASIETEMALQRLHREESISRSAEESGASSADLIRERDAAAAECRRITGLIRLWDRGVSQGVRAVVGTKDAVLSGLRDFPVDVQALAPDAVDPDDPPGALVVASPAAPHGPPAPWVSAAA